MSFGKLSDEKYNLAVEFVKARTNETKQKFDTFNSLSTEEQFKYKHKLKLLKDDLWFAFKKIVDGRIASLGLHRTLKDPENICDISADAIIAVFRYINRYDASRSSSAFAFVTQVAHNSIVASINAIKLRETTIITGLDFLDNINTLDDPTAAYSATNKFIKNTME